MVVLGGYAGCGPTPQRVERLRLPKKRPMNEARGFRAIETVAFRVSEALGIHKARLSLNDSGWLVPERSRRASPITALMNPISRARLSRRRPPESPEGSPPPLPGDAHNETSDGSHRKTRR